MYRILFWWSRKPTSVSPWLNPKSEFDVCFKKTATYQSNFVWIKSDLKEWIIFTTNKAQLKRHATVLSVFSDIYALLGYYVAEDGNSVGKFRGTVQVPFSGLKKSNISWPSKKGPIGFQTSVQCFHSALHNIPDERRSHLQHCASLK
jgi:hypothetical protein